MYFETGQGSSLSANAHHGVDQQTLEARAYAVARRFEPLLVNSVVGFIGPEYLYNGKQIIRAGLEDHFCGKLLGVPMGCDVCYTNHADADQDDMDSLLALLVAAGVNFVMGVPGADDIMLNYQSTSFHDVLAMRDLLGRRAAPEFEEWLGQQDLLDKTGRVRPLALPQQTDQPPAGELTRMGPQPPGKPGDAWAMLRTLTAARIALDRSGASLATAPLLEFRLAHARARDAVNEAIDMPLLAEKLADLKWPILTIDSAAPDRSAYLLRPDLGRTLGPTARQTLLPHAGVYDLAVVAADGLSARAVERQVPPLLAALAPLLVAGRWSLAPLVLVRQGRVAIGDSIAAVLQASAVVVLIGERPGLSAPDSLGAYLTWRPIPQRTTDADRNCISNIRPEGLGHSDAAFKLAYLLGEMRRREVSGVRLKDEFGIGAFADVVTENEGQAPSLTAGPIGVVGTSQFIALASVRPR